MAVPDKTASSDEFRVESGERLEQHRYQDEHRGTAADRRDMARMNKPQEMRRNFKGLTIFGFTAVLVSSWEVILSTGALGLGNGGSAGLLYTNLATWIGFTAVYASLGEQASMAPTSGGQYHWVSEFASRRWQKFLSYIVGWLGVLGFQTGVAFGAYVSGTQIQGLLTLNYPSYVYKSWHGTLLIVAVLCLSVFFNTFLAQKLHLVEGTILVLHVVGFFAILIPLWALSEKAPPREVWTTFYDPGWGNQGLSCLVGIVASVAPLLGADASAHMAEEIQDAAYIVPRTMVYVIVINGAMMFVMCITLVYCIGDLDSVLATPTGYPFIQVFYNSTQSLHGTNIMTAIIIILSMFACVSCTASASRQLFAFARDNGVPFSRWIAHVRPDIAVPFNAVLVVTIIGVLIALINIGSETAFNIVTSLGTGTLTLSYIVTIGCLIHRKITRQPLLPTRFDMGKRLGLLVNLVAEGWLCLVFVIAFFPPVPEPDAAGMNWSVVVFGAVVGFAVVYFLAWGRRFYDGPVEYVRKLD